MLSIGYTNEVSWDRVSAYASKKEYPHRKTKMRSGEKMLYFIRVEDMTLEQADDLNNFAKDLPNLEWLSDLRRYYGGVDRALDEFYL